MSRPKKSFERDREDACAFTLKLLQSRPDGMTLTDVRAYWRMKGSGGMADNALAWLEADGLVVWERETNMVFLTTEGGK